MKRYKSIIAAVVALGISSISCVGYNCETVKAEDTADYYTALELYSALGVNEALPYELNEKAELFLEEHDDLFPVEAESIIDETIIDDKVEYKHILKNSTRYGDKLMVLPTTFVVQIQEEEYDTGCYLTYLNLIDADGLQYVVYYDGVLDDIFDEDCVEVTGLPLGSSTFENTEGGETWVVVLAGTRVELSEEYEEY